MATVKATSVSLGRSGGGAVSAVPEHTLLTVSTFHSDGYEK